MPAGRRRSQVRARSSGRETACAALRPKMLAGTPALPVCGAPFDFLDFPENLFRRGLALMISFARAGGRSRGPARAVSSAVSSGMALSKLFVYNHLATIWRWRLVVKNVIFSQAPSREYAP